MKPRLHFEWSKLCSGKWRIELVKTTELKRWTDRRWKINQDGLYWVIWHNRNSISTEPIRKQCQFYLLGKSLNVIGAKIKMWLRESRIFILIIIIIGINYYSWCYCCLFIYLCYILTQQSEYDRSFHQHRLPVAHFCRPQSLPCRHTLASVDWSRLSPAEGAVLAMRHRAAGPRWWHAAWTRRVARSC